MKRRDLLKAGLALGTVLRGRNAKAHPRDTAAGTAARPTPQASTAPASRPPDADYIVVGSGAGGGTVAARLAESGYSVLLLEAGGDPHTLAGDDPLHPGTNALPQDYDVPAFHLLATENDALKWDFFVRHYSDAVQQRRDPNYVSERDGVWYPRAGTLGGCTAHNAMILVYPGNADWDQLADLTGDESWRADRMRTYFERLERCRHRPLERFWSRLGINASRHGWSGWLHTERVAPKEAIRDRNVRRTIAESVSAALAEFGLPSDSRLESLGDPNDWRSVTNSDVGTRYTPLTTRNGQRMGTRERVLEVRDQYPDRLKIELHALATRVLFDDRHRAVGVEYRKGERLYGAHPRPREADGDVRQAFAAREVILAGGAFNTPQLLMLSGVGPPDVLGAHGIPVRVALSGVGKNLQDRYEVAVVHRMTKPWDTLEGATFSTSDAQYREWAGSRQGIYASNGSLMSVVARSTVGRPAPDLFCFAVLTDFRGYRPNYSTALAKSLDCLTWVVLKGHTNNTAGEVTLRSANPRDTPLVNFRYFEEGSDAGGDDVRAVVEGVKLVRRMTEGLRTRLGAREELPGPEVQTDEDLKQFVRDHAWGHHASCTCPIGVPNERGVLSSDFKVHGTEGLRVVDASVFPRIPGLFIVSAVYMIGEKAADVILADAKQNRPPRR